MTLYTREFTVNGINVIVGHDRETGKRYFCTEVSTEKQIEDLPLYLYDTIDGMEKIKSIFWIE